MTQLGMTFDPNQHNPSQPAGGSLPISGKDGHVVVIQDSSLKNTADNTGTMLVLELKISGGDHDGITGPYRLNIGNNSADAVRIALSQLSAICHVVGHLQPLNDVSVLYNRPFRAIVALQTGKEAMAKGYTEVKGVLDIHGNKPGEKTNGVGPGAAPAPAPGGFPAPAQPAASGGFPPQQQQPPQQQPQQQPYPVQQMAPPQQQQPPQGQQPQGQQPQYQQPQQGQPQAPQQYPQGLPNPSAAPWQQPRA